MKTNEINRFIENNLITYNCVEVKLTNDKKIHGFFEFQEKSEELVKENKWYFVRKENIPLFQKNKSKDLIDVLNGNEIKSIKNFDEQLRDYLRQILNEAMETYNN